MVERKGLDTYRRFLVYVSTRHNFRSRLLARPENREQLEAEIRKADVICIVYAMNAHETFARVSSFWLPYIRKLGRNVLLWH